MKLSDGRITLRPATPADEERLWEILQEPEIVRWWGHEAREDLQSHLAGREQAVPFEIEHAGATAGMIQYCEENDPEFRHAGIDIYLTARLHGRGLGAAAIRLMVQHLQALGHHRITIDPAAANHAAIRCYLSVGFQEVGVMRAYWRDPDGVWRDGLLMELVAPQATSGSSSGSSGSIDAPGATRRSSS
jgi:aminoglycoside 6'-N-acetyltransferase